MAKRRFKFLNVLLFLAGAGSVTHADDACPPSAVLTSVDMRVAGDGRIYLPVKIGETSKSMLVDTGGVFSEVTQQLADELKLPTRRTRLVLVGVSGDTIDMATRAAFTLGNLHADATDFMIIPDAEGFADEVSDAAGILAPNLMTSYDVEIDFAAMKFSLHSQQHCDGKAVRWTPQTVTVVAIRLDPGGHIQLPVELDGQKLTATLDTGATSSVLNLELAKYSFGLTLGDADTPEFGRLLRSPSSKTYAHRFHSLALEGLVVANPTLHLIPDLVRNKMRNPGDSLKGGSRLPDSNQTQGFGDLILGMNILRQWHIYIAYKEQKLYLAPAPIAVSLDSTRTVDQPAVSLPQPAAMPPKPAGLEPH